MIESARRNTAPELAAEDIAIVGMACLLPRAEGPSAFWENIVHKVDAVSDPPPGWPVHLFTESLGDPVAAVKVGRGGYLGDLCRFDPLRYRVMPNSIEGSEPDQFIALRCAIEALADAGYPHIPLNHARTGVILGRGTWFNRAYAALLDHSVMVDQVVDVLRQLEPYRSDEDLAILRRELRRNLPPTSAETAPGQVPTVMVGRIANRLDLNGPAYAIDGACASALLAVENAVGDLRSGRCDAVLAGGVQISTPSLIHYLFSHVDALSRSGKLAPFSAEANGTLLGQGCGVLVLKRRTDAQRDGNRIYALIKGVGSSADGAGAGLLAPRQQGQELALRRAYEETGIATSTIGLIEAHGTGTPLGDLIEVRTLSSCFGTRTEAGPTIAMGSVKSMISHLIPASGAAALIKTSLALYHRVLPPTLHADQPRTALRLDQSPFYLNGETRPWIHGNESFPRRAGINAFGFGGINAHAILEEHPLDDETGIERLERHWPVELVVVSAADRTALAGRCETLAGWVEAAEGASLLDIAATLAGEPILDQPGTSRVSIVAKDRLDLARKLRHVAGRLNDPSRHRIQDRSGIFWYDQPLGHDGKLAFVFPGEGAQYVDMLSDLARHFPEVRRQFDLTDRAFATCGVSRLPSRNIFPVPEERELAEAELFEMAGAVEAVTTANRALAALLDSLDIRADAVMGHSSGEYAALVAAGVTPIESDEALVQAVAQGCHTQREMLAADLVSKAVLTIVGGVVQEIVTAAINGWAGRVEVAVDNCPNQVVLCADEPTTATIVKQLRARGAICQTLPWSRAYHTEAFTPACAVLERYFQKLHFAPPRIEIWSCATAAPYPDDLDQARRLAVRQWKSKVRFRETVEAMYDSGVRLFLEVGPRGNLTTFVADTLADRPHAAVPINVARKSGVEQLCRALGMLSAHGVKMRLGELYRRRSPTPLNLAADPPLPPKPQPLLPLDLPRLELGPDVVARLIRSAPHGAEAVARPAEVAAQSDQTTESHSSGSASAAGHPRPTSTTSTVPASPLKSSPGNGASRPTGRPATLGSGRSSMAGQPRTVPGSLRQSGSAGLSATSGDPRVRAFGEFQQTMQRFLESQQFAVHCRLGHHPPGLDEADHENGRAVQPLLPDTPSNGGKRPDDEVLGSAAQVTGQENSGARPRGYPLIQEIVLLEPGKRLVAQCELDAENYGFIRDHCFGRQVSFRDPSLRGLPLMPAAMMAEMMAEAAATLSPDQNVTALSDMTFIRWVIFEKPVRRLEIEAVHLEHSATRVTIIDMDTVSRDPVATGTVELGAGPPLQLDRPRISVAGNRKSRWTHETVYGLGGFQGKTLQAVRSMDGYDDVSARGTLEEPDPALMFPRDPSAEMILPVALMDGAGLARGLWYAEWDFKPSFPTNVDRLEFVVNRPSGPLPTVIRLVSKEGPTTLCDSETLSPDGEVVLRILGARDVTIDLEDAFWRFRAEPNKLFFTRDVTSLFAHVPGIESARISVLDHFGSPVLLQNAGFWSLALARLILCGRERESYKAMNRPPLAVASWLLGRIAVKDAVRRQVGGELCMADVEVINDPHGCPKVDLNHASPPLVSLAHREYDAIGVAVDAVSCAGVGIDLEPIHPLKPSVLADAYDRQERQRFVSLVGDSEDGLDVWHLAGWCSKEAVGKALGRGVIGGPHSIRLVDLDPGSRRFSAVLAGSMAEAFPQYAGGRDAEPVRIDVYWQRLDDAVVSFCLLPRRS